jgi:FG-GAP repeat protein
MSTASHFLVRGYRIGCFLTVLFTASIAHGYPEIKLDRADAEAGDQYGFGVALNESAAIVGAYLDDDRGSIAGSAYLFDPVTGAFRKKLFSSDASANDTFGISVAASGSVGLIGAPGNAEIVHGGGAAYLFDLSTGLQQAKLKAGDPDDNDRFGRSVAISGNRAIIGAFGDDGKAEDAGAAYLFDATTHQQLFKLTASDGAYQNLFGGSVAISGNRAIVGAYQDSHTRTYGGSAYLFDAITGQQLFKLTASDTADGDYFGNSVAIDGNLALVGAPYAEAAYLYNVSTGQQLRIITAADGYTGSFFGTSVAISGNLAVIGAANNSGPVSQSGAVYLFDLTTGQQIDKVFPSNGQVSAQFGNAVAAYQNRIVVGAYTASNPTFTSGAAYLYTIPEPANMIWIAVALSTIFVRCRH